MSENESRFFQLPSGTVVRVRGVEQVRDYEEDPATTEVQVVPVDAIVIRRDELPRVLTEPGAHSANVGKSLYYLRDVTEESMRSAALNNLAMAEYLREHPPVDEEQVAAVRDALLSADSDDVNYIEGDDAWKLARRMVEHFGVRVEAKS